MIVKIGLLTISDTRNERDDFSGQTIMQTVKEAGFVMVHYHLVKDEIPLIQQAYLKLVNTDCEVILTNGGTGISKRDVTPEALQPFIKKELPGFGELFRWLSFQEIGSHAMASRACAGFNEQEQLLFLLPGSVKACQLAMKQLILPEIPHLLKERRK